MCLCLSITASFSSQVMADTPGAHGLSAAAVAPKGYISRHFGDTPLMSSYLLAFVIGEFDYVQKTTEAGVDLKVFTPQVRRIRDHQLLLL